MSEREHEAEFPLEGVVIDRQLAKTASCSSKSSLKSMSLHSSSCAGYSSSEVDIDLNLPSTHRPIAVMAEERSTHQDHFGRRFVIYNSSTPRHLWSLVITLMLAYTGTFFIYRLCFWECRVGVDGVWDYTHEDFWTAVDAVIYWLFVVDLFVTFFFSYTDDYGVEVDSLRCIAKHYLATTFAINLLSCMPESLMAWIVKLFHDTPNGPGDLNQVFRVVRLQRISRLFRLFRLTRVVKVKTYRHNRLLKWFTSFKGVRVVNLCFALGWIVHLLACGWYLCAAVHDNPNDTWVARRAIDNSGEVTLLSAIPFQQWLHSMYFVLTVFTTVGFGDISAVTSGEIVAASITMVTGAVVHSIIISEVIGVVTTNDATNIFIRQKSDLVQAFAQHTELSSETSSELQSWIETNARLWVTNHYDREEMKNLITGKYMPRSLLGLLPDGLYNGRLVSNRIFCMCRFAGGVPPRLPTLLALAVHRCNFEADELVYQVNDFPFNLFMVISGTFSYAAKPTEHGGVPHIQMAVSKEAMGAKSGDVPNSTPSQWRSVTKMVQGSKTIKSYVEEEATKLFPYQLFPAGTYLGDIELFSGQPRQTTARCETAGGVVLSLHKNDLARLAEEFPQFGKGWRSAAIHHAHVNSRRMQALTRGMTYRHLAASIIQKFVRTRQAQKDVNPVNTPKLGEEVDRAQAESLRELSRQSRRLRSRTGCTWQKAEELQDLRQDMAALRSDVSRILQALSAKGGDVVEARV